MAPIDTVAKVKTLVFDSVFKRAQDIVGSNLLSNVSFDGNELEDAKADCIGSSPSDRYNLTVTVAGDTALGKCSCPASAKAKSGLCKHVIALLLKRSEELREKSATRGKAHEEEEIMDYPIVDIGSPEETPVSPVKLATPAKGEKHRVLAGSARPTVKESSSKRALPAWMLGVVGSAASGESLVAPKSKRKAPVEKPPRRPPPPAKRARRQGQPLKVAHDLDEDEDPGEIDDAEPVEALSDKGGHIRPTSDVVERNASSPKKQTRPRSRAELKELKHQAGEIESNKEDASVGARRGRGKSKSVSLQAEEKPIHRRNSRRVVGKLDEVMSDLSDNEGGLSSGTIEGVVLQDVTDDDLMLLAQEHVANEKVANLVGGSSEDMQADEQEGELARGKWSIGTEMSPKKTSKFSLHKWKELSSGEVNLDGPQALTIDSLDMETLKDCSQSMSQYQEETHTHREGGNEGSPSGHMRHANHGGNTTLATVPTYEHSSVDKDSVASDMLDLIFGSSLSSSVAVKDHTYPGDVPSASARELSDGANEVPFSYSEASEPNLALAESAATVINSTRGSTPHLVVEPKAKKKSSLRDKIKMFLD